ncbi:MAG: DUF58 domain-containing protein [Candidatus Dormibacteraeota bacterium]|nr:DUF58 domain-containing protein [Candidatus Dormibacteraeota bacterium]
MTSSRSAKLLGYALLSTLGLLASLALGSPVPAALAVPLLVFLVAGLAAANKPELDLSARLDNERALQGDRVGLRLELRAGNDVEWVQVAPMVLAGLPLVDPAPARGLRMRSGESRDMTIQMECRRWGVYRLGRLAVRAHDPFGLFAFESVLEPDLVLRVYPRPEALSRLLRPAETQVFAGNEVSRGSGEGIEFAEARPFVPGDQVRRINWSLSTRLGELHVNDLHPERNNDVVVFLDSFTELRLGHDGTLEMAVTAASALAEYYLKRRDRVGLVSFGGTLSWLRPSMGAGQRYQIVETLIETLVVESFAWKGIEVIPVRMLPPRALVLALTPLLDSRTVDALFDLRGRGYDLAVVEIDPESFMEPARGDAAALGSRLWRLRRDLLRHRYQQLGVAVGSWRLGQPLQQPLEEVRQFRRSARRTLA